MATKDNASCVARLCVAMLSITMAMASPAETQVRSYERVSLRARDHDIATALARDSASRWYDAMLWPIDIGLWYNSTRATPASAGPVWLGRGLNAAVALGAMGRAGPVSWSVRPVAYWNENRPYRFFSDIPAQRDYESAWLAGQIDLPQRFGSRSRARIDPGESFARLDVAHVGIGVSNAAQVWGPARLQPLTLSGQAGGFPHAFLEATGAPIGIGRLNVRWIAGQLEASGIGLSHAGTSERALIGAVAVFVPRSLEQLELGGLRLFHQYNSSVAFDAQSLTLPFEALFKNRIKASTDPRRETNQLASVFARLAPSARVELYTEYMREDHSANFRDFVGEPDHDAAYVIGVGLDSLGWAHRTAITLEAVNARMTHLSRVREQAPPYVHSRIIEGHTQRGLLLGSWMAIGGGGMQLRVNRRGPTPAAGWFFDAWVARLAQNQEGGTFDNEPTGEYALSANRYFATARARWLTGLLVEPGFGHIHSWNVQLHVSASALKR
ncbi:MAG TPA: capsule assembly Wzi family protein [Gemmatimonadaceae bacterium]|nr:capsule assembly Wzi family protein [Gemmatimonadaceae bacterium]